MTVFEGNVLFLDRSDINTDEIIPARYLTEISKQALKPYLLEDLKLEGFNPQTDIDGKSIIITRNNFGCGSSREHAPWALEVNGIYAVVAVNFARIFRQNMFNRGMLAAELDEQSVENIFSLFADKDCRCRIEVGDTASTIAVNTAALSKLYRFHLNPFDKALVESGGWLGYAERHY
ncbi:3-isopropylmalate dehydratase small subunit [Treponema sp. OMZ 840]|uniref:3-isopropylmalate dehydratase small subunit n=1 Tax=Treponema sp. OMZ 840 TaxID=244313 RepID=UPI003D924F22